MYYKKDSQRSHFKIYLHIYLFKIKQQNIFRKYPFYSLQFSYYKLLWLLK